MRVKLFALSIAVVAGLASPLGNTAPALADAMQSAVDTPSASDQSKIALLFGGTGNKTAFNIEFLGRGSYVPPGATIERVEVPNEFRPAPQFGGLTALSYNESLAEGLPSAKNAIIKALRSGAHVLVLPYSQSSSLISEALKQLHDEGYDLSQLEVIYSSNPRAPLTGVEARLAGLYLPFLDVTFQGPAPTVTTGRSACRRYDPICNFVDPSKMTLVDVFNVLPGYLLDHPDYYDIDLTNASTYERDGITYVTVDDREVPLIRALHGAGVVFEPLDQLIRSGVTNAQQHGPGTVEVSVNPVTPQLKMVVNDVSAPVAEAPQNTVAEITAAGQQLATSVTTGNPELAQEAVAEIGDTVKEDHVLSQYVTPEQVDQLVGMVGGMLVPTS